MFKRKIEKDLARWKESGKRCLLLYGPRQAGKTYTLKHFLKANFKSVVRFSFAQNPLIIEGFGKFNSLNDFFGLMKVEGDIPPTVFHLDDIQYYLTCQQSNRQTAHSDSLSLVELGRLLTEQTPHRLVASGTLPIPNSVQETDELEIMRLHPMDFEEFLWANNVGSPAIESTKDAMAKGEPINDYINRTFLSHFHVYLLVGGLPEAVSLLVKTHNMGAVAHYHRYVYGLCQESVTNYTQPPTLSYRLTDLYVRLSAILTRPNQRFPVTELLDKSSGRYENFASNVASLAETGALIQVYRANQPKLPLKYSKAKAKLFLPDVGVLSSNLLDVEGKIAVLGGYNQSFNGALEENAAAEILSAHGFKILTYWNSSAHEEVDFLLPINSVLTPVLLDSGKGQTALHYNHTALHKLIRDHGFPQAYVFGETNLIKESDAITKMPIYLLDFLRPND